MLSFIKNLFSSQSNQPAPIVVTQPDDFPQMHWRADSAFAMPRAQAFRIELTKMKAETNPSPAAQSAVGECMEAYWRALYQQWFDKLGTELTTFSEYAPNGFRTAWREDFVLLSPLDERSTELLAQFCERSAKRICRLLPGLARMNTDGMLPVVVFPDADTYEKYIAHFYKDEEESIASGGMFVMQTDDAAVEPQYQDMHGFAHFILLADELDAAEPVLVHEMTHALLSHLDIPLWLNEGLATSVEQTLYPRHMDPAFRLVEEADLRKRHKAYWTADTQASFWNGDAFQNGESSELAYDLARRLVSGLSSDMPALAAFAEKAHWRDGGAKALQSVYNIDLKALMDLELRA
jgi:hypothetical protein